MATPDGSLINPVRLAVEVWLTPTGRLAEIIMRTLTERRTVLDMDSLF
jgi:hypothetical protein